MKKYKYSRKRIDKELADAYDEKSTRHNIYINAIRQLLMSTVEPKKECLEEVPAKVLKLQLLSNKGVWEDVNEFDYPNNDAWTETGCYSIGLNKFRLIDVTPIPTPKKPIHSLPEKMGHLSYNKIEVNIIDKINSIIDWLQAEREK
jgi:hypothetical protein